MKVRQKQKSSKKLLLISGIVIVVAALAGASVYAVNHGSFFGWTPFPNTSTSSDGSSINYGPATDDEKATGADIKNNANPGNDSKPLTTEQPDAATTNNVVISIPYSGMSGSDLRVTTLIEKVTSKGTCTLTLSRSGSSSVTQTVDVQAQATTSTCKGFTISTTGLASGVWNLKVDYKDGTNTGSVSKEQKIN